MDTVTNIERPPGVLKAALSVLFALFLIIMTALILRSLWNVEDSMSKVATSGFTSSQLVVNAINDNDKLAREQNSRATNDMLRALDGEARAFGEGLRAISGSIDGTRKDVVDAIKSNRDMATSKMDSVIVGQDTTTKAVANGLGELNKVVAEIQATLKAQAPALATNVKPTAPAGSPPPLDNDPPVLKPRIATAPAVSPETRIESMGPDQRNSIATIYEIMAGAISPRFYPDDIRSGKVRLSRTEGVVMRSYLRGWGKGWIDAPLDAEGNYHMSPQASKVSFYSETGDFEVRVYK